MKKWITFNRVVKNVEYNEHEDNFKVVVKNASEDRVMAAETFDMVFVASGNFLSSPLNMLLFDEKYPIKVITPCRMCPTSPEWRSSLAGSAMHMTSVTPASLPARGSS